MALPILWGLVIATIWIAIGRLSLPVIVFSWGGFPWIIPILSETAGYFLTLQILRRYRWPEVQGLGTRSEKNDHGLHAKGKCEDTLAVKEIAG